MYNPDYSAPTTRPDEYRRSTPTYATGATWGIALALLIGIGLLLWAGYNSADTSVGTDAPAVTTQPADPAATPDAPVANQAAPADTAPAAPVQ